MKKAVIDIGTNSVRLLAAQQTADGAWQTMATALELSRLGEGVGAEQIIQPQALNRTATAVTKFVEQAKTLGCSEIIVVATSAVREARNKAEVCAYIREKCGIEVQVLSGEEEAEAGFRGAVGEEEMVAVLDIGGGSTELVYLEKDKLICASVPVGTVRMLEQDEMKKNYPQLLEQLFQYGNLPPKLIGVGGTATTLAAMELEMEVYDASKIQGYVLTKQQLERWATYLAQASLEERKKIKGLQEKRADVIGYGLEILLWMMERMKITELTVSDRDLLYALLSR